MSIHQRKSDGLWIGVVDLGRDGAGKRRRRTVSAKSKTECKAKLRRLERDLEDHLVLGVNDRTTVSQWMRHWLDNIAIHRIRPRTYTTYHSLIIAQINPTIGDYRLVKLGAVQIREFIALNRAAKFSSATVAGAYSLLSTALRDAVREQYIRRNPCEMVDAPKILQAERPTLTAEQVRRFMAAAIEHDDRMVTRWAVAFTMGLRQGEALGLEWSRVWFNADPTPLVDLSWQLSPLPYKHGCGDRQLDGRYPCAQRWGSHCPQGGALFTTNYAHKPLRGALALTPPKTTRSVRRIPLLAPMAKMLAEYRDQQPANDYGLVWVSAQGHPLHPSQDAARWYAALERAGLEKMPLHSARHTTATLLLEAGVPLYVISQILGHSSTKATSAYAHVAPALAASALGALDGLLAL